MEEESSKTKANKSDFVGCKVMKRTSKYDTCRILHIRGVEQGGIGYFNTFGRIYAGPLIIQQRCKNAGNQLSSTPLQ